MRPPPTLRDACAAVRALRGVPLYRLRLADLNPEGALATCTRGPRALRFTITIHAPLALSYPALARVLLLHEVAHAMTWTRDAGHRNGHSPAWGRAYARLWRALHSD